MKTSHQFLVDDQVCRSNLISFIQNLLKRENNSMRNSHRPSLYETSDNKISCSKKKKKAHSKVKNNGCCTIPLKCPIEV